MLSPAAMNLRRRPRAFLLALALTVSVGAGALAAPASVPVLGQPAARQAPALGVSELADRVQAFYDQSKTFKAKFKQRYFIAAYNKFKDSSGSVAFEKPG